MRKTRWVGVGQLADETGLAVRTIQYILAREPGVLVTRNGKQGTEYEQPTCAVALRKREAEKAQPRAKPAGIEESEQRIAAAQAETAELKLEELRKRLMTVEEGERWAADLMARVDARFKNLPQRIAAVDWSPDMTERVRQATPLIDEVRAEMYEADDVPIAEPEAA